jgi:hypothetical protein
LVRGGIAPEQLWASFQQLLSPAATYVCVDPESSVLYRQQNDPQIAAWQFFEARLGRIQSRVGSRHTPKGDFFLSPYLGK